MNDRIRFGVSGIGFRVWGLGFRVEDKVIDLFGELSFFAVLGVHGLRLSPHGPAASVAP